MKRTTSRPRLEELETRDVPSVTLFSSSPQPVAASVARHATLPAAVVGTLTGTFTQMRHIADTGASYALTGGGSVRPLGKVTVNGSMTAPGFVRVGRASGTLTLTGSGGTVKVRLLGPEEGGFKPLPERFHFTAGSGTGAYQHLTGSGIALLRLTPPPIMHPTAGTFTLILEILRA
jgi:hypothetical protein